MAEADLSQDRIAVVVLLLLGSAWVTEWLGVHALFGAFVMGAAMPKDEAFVSGLQRVLEDFTLVFPLPIFFADMGLRTRIGLLDEPGLWLLALLVLGVAVAGKLGGSAVAARLTGMGWRDALALGALMYTRGLMELVVLNGGLEVGAITPASSR